MENRWISMELSDWQFKITVVRNEKAPEDPQKYEHFNINLKPLDIDTRFLWYTLIEEAIKSTGVFPVVCVGTLAMVYTR